CHSPATQRTHEEPRALSTKGDDVVRTRRTLAAATTVGVGALLVCWAASNGLPARVEAAPPQGAGAAAQATSADFRCGTSFHDEILQDKQPGPPRETQAAPQDAAMNWRLPTVPRRWVVRPPRLDQDKVVHALPDSVEDVIAAGGGRFLILSLPK